MSVGAGGGCQRQSAGDSLTRTMTKTFDFWRGRRVLVTGSSGFVGRNLIPLLRDASCDVLAPSHADYDLLEQDQVRAMFRDCRPEVVIHLAGLIGGILANKERPADFCYQNLVMGTMALHEAWRAGVQK